MKTNNDAKIRVLAVDDHPVILSGLSAMFKNNQKIDLVGFTSSGKKAVEQAKKLQPDVVIMNLSIPLGDGMETARQIRRLAHGARILIFSAIEREEDVMKALKAGATGFISKKANLAELEQAIIKVANGESWLSPAMVRFVLSQVETQQQAPYVEKLTGRELEVLKHMASGHSNQEIAEQMNLSMATVHTHVSHVLAKLNASNRTQAVIFGMRAGLIPETTH